MGNRLIKLILILLFPMSLFSQSEGGFGFRRYSNTTNLNNTSVSNSNTSASRNAYVHSNGLYYVWDGNSWEREEDIDTLSLSGNVLSISLYGDGVPAKTVDLSTNIYCDAVVSPPSFSTNQDNYNPAGLSSACELRLTTTAQVNITGIVAQSDGFELILTNEGNHPITLSDNITSTAVNRFLIGYAFNLGSNQSVKIRYDATASRWRVVDNLSLSSGSGRIAGGRSQHVYWSYQTDTLNDVALGYFTNGTTDDKAAYGKFGLHIDGDGGFQIGGKETYIKGANFDLLNTSRIAARESSFDLTTYKRNSIGGAEDIAALYGVSRNSAFFLNNDVTYYYDTGLSLHKDWSGTPRNRKDYGALVQEGEYDGSSGDTSSVVIWWGIPQITDTVSSFGIFGNVSAVSKERGFGVQSVFDLSSTLLKYDWMKIKMGNVAADTAVHSSSNDGITFYGNSYEIPNEVPSSSVGDSSVIVWTGRYNAFFIDIDDIKGSSVNIFNSNGIQDDLSRYFEQDSTKEFFMGQFDNIPDINYDGTEKGYYYSPDYLGEVGLINGNGTQGDYANLSVTPDNITIYSQDGNNAVRTSANLRIRPDAKTNDMLLSAAGVTKINGISRIIQAFNDTIDYIAIGHDGTGGNTRAYMTVGTGGNNANFFDKSKRRKFSWQYQKAPLNNPYLLLEGRIPATSVDTTADALWFYNGSYGWDNSRPISTNGIMSFHYWRGNGTNTTPGFITMSQLADSLSAYSPSVNIFNSDGTQDDADRYFTQDSTRTFAMGQFSSVSTPTWGRGYYYDPSTANGIRILNKDGSNTSQTKVELDPFSIQIKTDYLDADATYDMVGLPEEASHLLTVDRTSDTYGSIVITARTNTNEEVAAIVQAGKTTKPTVSMYLGDGYSSSQYAKYPDRAWGVQTHLSGGEYDWIQVLLPDTGTDTTGNNLNFYNRAYYWKNGFPSATNADTSIHVWVGNGTTTTPIFVELATLMASGKNIYNSNGTTTQNTRTANILESIQWVGTADFDEPFPFQIISTGTEPNIQLWKGNADSVWIKQNDTDYEFFSSAIMTIGSDDYLALQADSLLFSTVADKTKMKYILGKTPTNSVVEFDGDAATIGDGIISNGVDWTISPTMERTTTTSGAGTLNLGTSTAYIFTGTTTTWTLPTVAGNTNKVFFIKNRGSGAITLNSNAGGNDIYTTSAVNTITINAGESALLWNDGTYFLEMY